MGGIGQNLYMQCNGSEILCAISMIRAPHKTYVYQILWQNRSYFESYGLRVAAKDIVQHQYDETIESKK